MNVNIKAAFFMSQAAGREMVKKGRGKIINIASMLSFQGGIRVPSYTASKSGIAGITRLLAMSGRPKGINSNAIAPGYMATDNTAQLRADEDRSRDNPRPHSGGALGVAGGFGRDRGFPGQRSIGLCERCGDSCRWRLACTLNAACGVRRAWREYIATW